MNVALHQLTAHWRLANPPLVPRVERCVCGGVIRAVAGEEPRQVALHQVSEQHRAWRVRLGL
ncbi:MAG TPA: hypothetical protein VFW92_08550 [Candidatus Limnocylindrales bacterium]|nr:hypothetical protein [Candidatus Limnocylindrales bacterium]